MKPSVFTFLAMEDTIDTGTPPPVLLDSVQPFPLIALPIEVRNKILGHLLPNSLEVKPPNPLECFIERSQLPPQMTRHVTPLYFELTTNFTPRVLRSCTTVLSEIM